ncbi:hypothetical protein N825_03600 [Skermanella stibiiresistens SB22]|jgi:hypothetical protein|uniref:Motility protein n=1 Tax=Skermanella stibiiresistens SB22 TaxID=1385369 RepID=W9H639_9PROT|nr:hypothetical protein [Skermanella stibiiresistens]EWY40147.1 hypothetical protein N825_03600 [Skermanella stibiiresistens SB22]
MEVGQYPTQLGVVGMKIAKKSQETQAQVVTQAMQNTKELVQSSAQSSGGAGKMLNIKA